MRAYGGDVRLVTLQNVDAASLKHGMSIAGDEYLPFLDANDIWHPQRLSSQLPHFARYGELGIVFVAWQEWYPDSGHRWTLPGRFGEPLESGRVDPEASGRHYTTLLLDCVITTITVLTRTTVAREIGSMHVDLNNGEGDDYWLRVSRSYPIRKRTTSSHFTGGRAASRGRSTSATTSAKSSGTQSIPGASARPTAAASRHRCSNVASPRYGSSMLTGKFHGGCPALAALSARRVIRHAPWRLDGWKYYFLSKIKQLLSPGEPRWTAS